MERKKTCPSKEISSTKMCEFSGEANKRILILFSNQDVKLLFYS